MIGFETLLYIITVLGLIDICLILINTKHIFWFLDNSMNLMLFILTALLCVKYFLYIQFYLAGVLIIILYLIYFFTGILLEMRGLNHAK